jgi:hypothetical protein
MRGAGEHYDQDVEVYIAGISGTCNKADSIILVILELFDLKEVQLNWSLTTEH